jgi:hypothetical protein
MALRLVSDAAPTPISDRDLWWTHLTPPATPAKEQDPVGKHPLLKATDLDPGKPMLRPALFSPTNDAGER